MNTLWAENDKPANAMKYAIFRLRSYLKNIRFLNDLELIVNDGGGYVLNPAYTYEIDTESFDACFKQIKELKFYEKSIPYALHLLDLYHGDIYTMDHIDFTWVQPANVYYRSIYQNVVTGLCAYYLKEKQTSKVCSIASKATMLNPDFEEGHAAYIRALLQENKFDEALSYYRETAKMLNDVYEHGLSEEIRSLYPSIILNNKSVLKVSGLVNQLHSSALNEGAFYCEYDVFEYMFQNILRLQSRTKDNYFLLLFDILSCPENQEVKIMDRLSIIISRSLRFCDVYTRINKVQIAVLLQSKDEEGAHTAAQRVLQEFNKRKANKVKITYAIQAI